MIAQVDNPPSLLSSQETLDGIPLHGQQGESLFTQLFTQLLDSLSAPPQGERQLSGMEEVAAAPLRDMPLLLNTASGEPDPDALDSLLAALHDILQQLPLGPPPAATHVPATEATQQGHFSTQASGNQPAAASSMVDVLPRVAGGLAHASVSPQSTISVQPSGTEAGSVSVQASELYVSTEVSAGLPRSSGNPEGVELSANSSTPVSQPEVRTYQGPEKRTLQPASEFSSSAPKSPSQPLQPDVPSLSDNESTFAGSGPVGGALPPDNTRGASVDTSEMPTPPRYALVPPETAARILGRPLPGNTVLLQLEPPELGYLQVQVHLTNERLVATFWAESPEVRALLQAHFPTLNQTLSTQGFQPHQISIDLASDGFIGDSGPFFQHHSGFQSYAPDHEPTVLGADSSEPMQGSPGSQGYTHDRLVDLVI